MIKEAGFFCNAAGIDSLFAVIADKSAGNNSPYTCVGLKLLSSFIGCQ
jgi:hypothetical protein